MQWLFAALSSIAFVEVLARMPFFATLQNFRQIVSRVMALIRSDRISDHWKEKVLPRYAFAMLRATLVVGGCMIAAFLPFVAFAALAGALGVPLLALSLSWVGIVFITLVALGYAKARSALAPALV
jgi:hypothetical protein